LAARRTSEFANDWQWLIGIPAVALLLYLLDKGGGKFVLPQETWIDVTSAADAVFLITWVSAFVVGFFSSAATFIIAKKSVRTISNSRLNLTF